jgi:hypothetical protein
VTQLLCAAPHCCPPGHHGQDCAGETCRGCLPARAADGLYLCWHCAEAMERDAPESARLWGELGLCLIGAGDQGEVRASNPQPGLSVRDAVVEHRATIRHTLVSWTLLVTEERGIELPWRWTPWELVELPTGVQGPLNRVRERVTDESTFALGSLLAAHSRWIAQQPFAGEAAGELRELVRNGRSLRQPSGTRVVQIGPCPQSGEDGDCPGTLRAMLRREASLLPSAVTCDANEEHSWDSTQWTKLGRRMRVTT